MYGSVALLAALSCLGVFFCYMHRKAVRKREGNYVKKKIHGRCECTCVHEITDLIFPIYLVTQVGKSNERPIGKITIL